MVGLSFCDFVGTRDEKAIMAEYRKKEWPRRYKVPYYFLFSIKMSPRNLSILLEHFAHHLSLKCRMVPTCGNWLCRSERKDDAL